MDPTRPYYRLNNPGSSSAPVRYFQEFDETRWVEPSFEYGEEQSLQTLPVENDGRNIRPDDPSAPSFATRQYSPNQEYNLYPPNQSYNHFQTYPQGPPGPTLPWECGTLTCVNCENPPEPNAVRCQSCTFFNRGLSPQEELRHCMKCLVHIEAPYLFCYAHQGRQYLSRAEINHLQQNGVCYNCLSLEIQPTSATCTECKSRRTEERHRVEQERLRAGICKKCGRNRLDNSSEICNRCRGKNQESSRVYRDHHRAYYNSLPR